MYMFISVNFRTISVFSVPLLVLFLLIPDVPTADCSREGEIISNWAETLGGELWELGQRITKAPELKKRYSSLNIRVEAKNGKELLHSAVETVGRMLTRKMEAIRCIMEQAEEMSQYDYNDTAGSNFTYYSSKFSFVDGEPIDVLPHNRVNDTIHYRNFSLNADTHFYNIPVNTSFSTVHAPTNLYDLDPQIKQTILWSESLDEVFVQNYKADPALSWQYFCSSNGIMRQYPGVAWNFTDKGESKPDLFDCRTRSWFIEASTCSKDVVILFDNSGSMAGYRNFVATFTVKMLLDTFSNNDFVNILSFSNGTEEVVPCFKDILAQATPENIRTFNEALEQLSPEGYANFTNAYIKAFELLDTYRRLRGCGETRGCNQVIMLITDGVPGNLTNVFELYNWLENGTSIPVRIFTYLIGKEVTNVREIQWMACLNRGYYVHIQSLDEVPEKVLKYINVIARPMVLQKKDHPVTWTHIYTDITPSEKTSKGRTKYRLMSSAAIPIYDVKANSNNETKTADLLGVAGTDVPIEEIDRLTLPYKLGVNGYSFIVSNNGYLLLHPELRPVYKGIRKENYNSVDIVEVEAIDESNDLRHIGVNISLLREALVGEEEGFIMNQTVKIMYDKMRRIQLEKQDYYFAPLPKTSFFLGIVLPHDYGNTWIKVGDEIKRNQHLGYKVENFFQGDNWKIHPKWVYCKYHYLEGHEFNSPEEELLHFLKKMEQPNWEWSEQYDQEPDVDEDENDEPDLNCGRKTLDDDDYFCNKELVQLLVFDAKATDPLYKTWVFKDKAEEQLFLKYNASLRFAATMSGLTRWQFVFGEDVNSTDEFGDHFTEAVDETWYRSAIYQHQIEQDSFVFSVPFDSDKKDDVVVTASYAVFPRDGGNEAPVGVLGYQFSHQLLYERFMEITSQGEKCDDCFKTCASDDLDCYILDNSGYVIVSENYNDTGEFFGEIDGTIMRSMVDVDIYQEIITYDLQGVCFKTEYVTSDCSILLTPITYLSLAIQWLGAQIMWLLMQTHLSLFWKEPLVYPIHFDDDYYEDYGDTHYMEGDILTETTTAIPKQKKIRKGQDESEEEFFNRPPKVEQRKVSYPCDRMAHLYILQQENFINGDGFMAFGAVNCTRPYYVRRIPHSNMIMVVVDALYPYCDSKMKAGAYPIPLPGDDAAPCYKLHLAELKRRPLEGCYTEHDEEKEISQCGRSTNIKISGMVFFICFLIIKFKHYIV